MSWLNNLLAKIVAWFQPRYRAVWTEDLPDELKRHEVYLVGEGGAPWQAAFLCPCRCGALIQLSLVPRDRPSWRSAVDANRLVTLHPSVWRTTGCGSHFFVRRGRIVAARGWDNGIRPVESRARA